MKKVKHIIAAVAVIAVVGSSLGLSANAKRASLCLYKRNGTGMCPFQRIVNNGFTTVTQARILTNNGNCPSAVAVGTCIRTVNVQLEP